MCYGWTMARKTNCSRRLAHSVTPLDGERMVELQDVVSYMLAIGDRHKRRAWQHVAELLLDAAERDGSVEAVRRQVLFALLIDGKLDAAATVPGHVQHTSSPPGGAISASFWLRPPLT
jgi:hypothetical protein